MGDWFFDAPGDVKDFHDPKNWHAAMEREARGIIRELVAAVLNTTPDNVTDEQIRIHGPTLSYVDPVSTPQVLAGETLSVAPWGAFPRAVRRRSPWNEFPSVEGDPEGVHRAAEHLGEEDHRSGVFVDEDDNALHLPVRDRQDEYLEWVAERNSDGKLAKVTFVAEGYDYYSTLFEYDEGQVLELYREFTGDRTIHVDDLRARKGVYRRLANGSRLQVVEPGAFNPRNRHNINPGIVHLSHRANSLGAEVNLAGVSAILRLKANGKTRVKGDDAEELLCCCQGGNPNRNSDPSISQQAYLQVLEGYRYTLANPVGLYIAGADHHRLLTKGGDELSKEWWTVVRGNGFWTPGQGRVLRLELTPPKGEKLTLEDLEVDGEPVRFGGQLADILQVHLFITRWKREGADLGPSVPCIGTCCRKIGTDQLIITDTACGVGFNLAFPGLIDDVSPQAPLGVELASDSKSAR
jgi:hypothetical protein